VKKVFDVIVVGELNIDLIFNRVESLPEVGKEKLAGEMILTLGSSAAIFASNLSALGVSVSFIGKIGNDVFGRFCKSELEAKRVDTSMLLMDDTLKTGATVVLNFGEDRANVTYQGAMSHLGVADITQEKLSKAKHLHFSSYFLQPGFKTDLAILFKMAKNAGMTTSLDVQWDPKEEWEFDHKRVLPFVDVFLPNEKELLGLTNKTEIDSAIDLIKEDANIVAVKRGNQGAVCYQQGKKIMKPAFLNGKVVDAIGAGDSFNAGFISKFINDFPLETCMEFGNLIGAISTTAAGGTNAFTDLTTTMKVAREKFGYDK